MIDSFGGQVTDDDRRVCFVMVVALFREGRVC